MSKTQDMFKGFYDQWLKTQQQFVSQMMESSQNLQKTISGDTQKTTEDYYKQLSEQQQAFYTQWTEALKNMQSQWPGMTGLAPSFAWPWPGTNGNGNGAPQMPQSPEAFFKLYENQMKQMQEFWNQRPPMPWPMLNPEKASTFGAVVGLYESWMQVAKLFNKQVQKNTEDLLSQIEGHELMKENVHAAIGSTEAYMKLLEFWMPLYKQMQDKALTAEDLQQLADPKRYKEVMDKMFEFASPDVVHEFYTQAGKIMESAFGTTQAGIGRYNEMMDRNTKLLPELMSGDPKAAIKVYENLYEAQQKNLDPMLKASLNGRDGELFELTRSVLDKYTDYIARHGEFQYKVYTTGQKALEEVLEKTYDLYKDTKEPVPFDAFFKLWAEANEEAFNEVFKTKEFAKIQNDMMDAGLEMREHMQKMTELYLAEYPLVPRSEMDELYKTVHDLKAKVRELEKGAKTPATTTSKSNTTAKAKTASRTTKKTGADEKES